MNTFNRFKKFMASIGPAFFLVGYTIGTGSVVSMASAGSRYGFSLLWALALSCIFSFILLEAFGKYSVVTQEGALYAYKTHFKSIGPPLAIITLIGLVLVEIMALIGIMGVISDLIHEWTFILFDGKGWNPLWIAVGIIILIYILLFIGEYSFIEKIMTIFVSIMGLSFILTMFMVLPDDPTAIAQGLIPTLLKDANAPMILAAAVGTTLTAPTFVVRSVLMKEKSWTTDQLKEQKRDALTASLLMFVISGSIMACAAGTLYVMNKPVEEVITMVTLLEPLLGRFAISVFIMGILGAGLSSILPIVMLAPLLIGDYTNKPINYKGPLFRILTLIGLLFGIIVPILGVRPIFAMLLSQLFQVFILPILIIAIACLLNRKDLMGKHKAGIGLNIGLLLTLIFSLIISYQSIVGLKTSFNLLF